MANKLPPLPPMDWHCHHAMLAEVRIGTRKRRIAYIKSNKPEDEQATRLRLYKRVRAEPNNPLYIEAQKAYAGLSKAYAGLSKADAAWSKADAAWSKADAAYSKARHAWLNDAHPRQCKNCPWNGYTIFPKGV